MELLDDFACPEPIVIQPIPLPVSYQADEKTDAGASREKTETCTGNAAETNDPFMLDRAYALENKSTITFLQLCILKYSMKC